MASDPKTRITQQANHLEEMIADYSISQQEFWRRIPYLALMADSYIDSDSNLRKAYEKGYWNINYSTPSSKALYVDCETGEICYQYYSDYRITQFRPDDPTLRPSNLAELAYHLDDLDANAVMNNLKRRIDEKTGGEYKPRLSAWQQKRLYELGLDENTLYTRTEQRKNPVPIDDNLVYS